MIRTVTLLVESECGRPSICTGVKRSDGKEYKFQNKNRCLTRSMLTKWVKCVVPFMKAKKINIGTTTNVDSFETIVFDMFESSNTRT